MTQIEPEILFGVNLLLQKLSFVSEIELQVWNPANPDDIVVYEEFVLQSHIIGINPGIIFHKL